MPCRVLLADDTGDLRTLYRYALEADGRFEVIGEASDGAEAAQLAEELQPDAVVLDLRMPRMDGIEALLVIRLVAPDAAVVILSGTAADHVERRVIDLGAHAFIEKGTTLDEFVEAVAGACAS